MAKFVPFMIVFVCNVFAQVLYKYSILKNMGPSASTWESIVRNINALSLLGMLLQMIGLAAWFFLLKRNDLIWSGLMASLIPVGIVLTGFIIFGEPLSPTRMIGMVLVVIGLFIVNMDFEQDIQNRKDIQDQKIYGSST